MAERPTLSRRELLKRAGLAGTIAAIPAPLSTTTAAAPAAHAPPPVAQREAFETLSAAESDTLEAVVDRLIPSDATGPGAKEARAAHYIDRALGGPLAASRAAYAAGLTALNAYAQTAKGAPFAKLTTADQDTVLGDVETNAATGFTPNGSSFFNLVRSHTIEGMFADPYYGGNANFVGWDLIQYPGVRISVTANEQQLPQAATPNHRSAYDFAMFSKAKLTATADHQDSNHGD